MKKLFLELILVAFTGVCGLDAKAQDLGSLRPIERIYYQSSSDVVSKDELSKVKSLIDQVKADSTMTLCLVGYDDGLKPREQSDYLAANRSTYLVEYIKSYGIDADRLYSSSSSAVSGGGASDVKSSCRVDVYNIPDSMALSFIVMRRNLDKKSVEESKYVEVKRDTTTVVTSVDAGKPVSGEGEARVDDPKFTEHSAATLQVHTNLLYWLAGAVNVGAEYKNRQGSIGVLVGGGYSPVWASDFDYNLELWYLSAEVRYYLPRNPRWFVGAQLLYGEYDCMIEDRGYLGSVLSGGVTTGYQLRLTDRFDMAFTLGVGCGILDYDSYRVADGFNVIDERDVNRFLPVPVQLGVNLIWKLGGVFGSKNK